jgi:hypothetical protein
MCATVSVDFPHWPLFRHEKTNVGVDDVVEVNSSTFIGPKFGLKSSILAFKGGWGTLGANLGAKKLSFEYNIDI